MQAGSWKDTRMRMRYGERVLAARGGTARAAKEQGRDSFESTETGKGIRGGR
jgi:hypothetical protein